MPHSLTVVLDYLFWLSLNRQYYEKALILAFVGHSRNTRGFARGRGGQEGCTANRIE
jgi:hypothetical protein